MLKELPIPPDQLDDHKLHDVAYGGDAETDEEILKKFEGELLYQKKLALLRFTFAEKDRVSFLEDFTSNFPPRARNGFWSWTTDSDRNHDIIDDRVSADVSED